MFKFLRRNKQQPQPEANHEERPTTPEQPVVDNVDHLEEVLKPLFETVKPTVPEDYFVPISEVERLWSRFQQLGPNDEGTVESEVFQHPSFTTDPFLRQVWRTFPTDENGNVNFQSFVGVLMWWKTAPLEQKLEGIFKLLNKAQPLDVPALQKVIMKLDSGVHEETAKSKAELLVKTLDDKEQGYIDVDQWLRWVLQLPEDEIAKLTRFEIIPVEMESHAPPSRSRSGGESEIPDELLITTAAKIGEKDWVPLARELGFTKQEIRDVKKKYPHRSREQVYQMLVSWRHKMGHEATVAALELSTSNARIETLSAES